jgi:hypothetical protein
LAEVIDGMIAKHALVRPLVEHGWLHLFRIDPATDPCGALPVV